MPRYTQLIYAIRDRSALLNFKNIQNPRCFFFFFHHKHALSGHSGGMQATASVVAAYNKHVRAESIYVARSLRACKSNSLDIDNSRTNPIAWRNDISMLHSRNAEMIPSYKVIQREYLTY